MGKMGKKVYAALLVSSLFCGSVFGMGTANNKVNAETAASDYGPWQISASVGYTHYKNAYSNDGNTIVGRGALGVNPFRFGVLTIGIEAGVQNGNEMRLDVSPCDLYQMGGVSINTTIKPIVDLLATMNLSLNDANTFSIIAKAGAAYRQWQFDRDTISNVRQVNPEIQAGFGLKISNRTRLVVYYQGIYGGNANFTIKPNTDYSAVGHVDHIPTQQGGFLGIDVAL